MVAVMSYSGYDIEDAVVLNKASLDRGFGRCMVMRKATAFLKKYPNGSYDRLVPPPIAAPGVNARAAQEALLPYHSLDRDGICQPGEILSYGDIYVNKQVPVNTSDQVINADLPDTAFRNSPLTYKGPSAVSVDKVLLTSNEEEHFFVKILLRSTRRPELGDKFSSRHGQKGVTGLIVNQCNMPFTEYGITTSLSFFLNKK